MLSMPSTMELHVCCMHLCLFIWHILCYPCHNTYQHFIFVVGEYHSPSKTNHSLYNQPPHSCVHPPVLGKGVAIGTCVPRFPLVLVCIFKKRLFVLFYLLLAFSLHVCVCVMGVPGACGW